jgi:hypothetical protein
MQYFRLRNRLAYEGEGIIVNKLRTFQIDFKRRKLCTIMESAQRNEQKFQMYAVTTSAETAKVIVI